LAGLFDEAWRHGRKRQSRAIWLLLLVVTVAASVLLATDGGAGHARIATARVGAAVDGRYQVCASDIDNLWRYTYGAGCATTASIRRPYSYHDLIVPSGSEVDMRIARARTAHALRITALGITLHASTQSTVETRFRTPRARGVYSGECLAECADRSFASTSVEVVTAARFKDWLAAQTSAISAQRHQAGKIRATLIRQHFFAPNAPQALAKPS
jgi:heme/copper-type cytochrome/quinol oxidase subunit 2